MIKSRTLTIVLMAIILIFSSCVSRKKLTYLKFSARSQNDEMVASEIKPSVTPSSYKLIAYDNLYIRVLTPDPQWSALFNMEVGSGGLTEESAALSGYIVDKDGNIEIPYVGKIKVLGKTLSDVKVELDSVFKNYVTDASIIVKLVNNYVSIIGEVRMPGRYPLTKDCINIFEAVAMAGDMGEFSNRQRIQLIRPSPYGPVVKEFSLSDRSILTSEYYYIMPNDIIYAMPMKGKSFQINSPIWTLFLTTITSAMGIIAFFRTL